MLLQQSHHRLFFSTSPFLLSLRRQMLLSVSPPFYIHRHASVSSLSALPRTPSESSRKPSTEVADASGDVVEEEGPIELPPPSLFSSSPSIFATTDDPTPLQTATSVLLTGAISVFLFRSLRRRAKRAKELKFRSSGAKKSLEEEAMENLKAMGSASIEAKKSPPSPAQAFLGAIAAGVIALILYKFTITVEAALNRQSISDNFSVRQITITIRTIVNGLCYLATFVFGINSIGLFLYSGQLAINSFMEDFDSSSSNEDKSKGSTESSTKSLSNNKDTNTVEEDQRSGN